MTTRALGPWTDLVKLHPDVEGGALTEAVFAARETRCLTGCSRTE